MDDIQRKLARIDAQRATRLSSLSLLARTAPLFFPALGLMAGILPQELLAQGRIGSESPILLWTWTALLGLSAATVCVGLAGAVKAHRSHSDYGTSPTDRSLWLAFGASVCFLCLGAIRLLAFETAPSNDIRRLVGEERRLATIRGRILTEPYLERQDWCFAPFANADPSCSFYLNVQWIKTLAGWSQIAGTVRVHVDEPAPNLRIGDHILVYCWLHRFEGPTNPGQFDVRAYLRRNNVHVGASVPSRDAVEVQAARELGIIGTLRRRLTDAASRGLLEHTPPDTQDAAMLQALLLGDRRDIDRNTYEAFRKTGLAHIISLSGMHLAILIGAVWWFCKLGGLSRRARAVVCTIVTAAFLLVVPPMAPILRAAVIVWVYCLAVALGRRVNPLNSLSLAAIILLLIRPTQLFEAGWQLSFSAVAGILAFTTRIEHFLHERAGGWFHDADRQAGVWTRFAKSTGPQVIRLFSAGTAAWLGNAGILLYHFYTVTPLASVWTVLATLPVTGILTLGFLKIVLSWLLPTLGLVLATGLSLLVDLFLWIVRLAAAIDFSSLLIGHVPLTLILLYYVLILFATFVPLRRPALKGAACAVMAVILVGSLGVMKWQRTHRDHLSLTCLDVGHGQAIVARLPGTTNLLFDAGSIGTSDVGTRIVVPYLDYVGVSRLHAVVLSHGDIDHINGVPEVVSLRRVDRVYVNEAFPTQAARPETVALLLSHLESRGVKVARLPADLGVGPARIRTVWPPGRGNAEFGMGNAESTPRDDSAFHTPHSPLAATASLSDNDSSLVCLLQFAGVSVLLCSDIERFAQGQIVGLYPELKADVVVVPHHGSIRTLDERFLQQLRAKVQVCSCGRQDVERGRVIPGGRQAPGRNPQAAAETQNLASLSLPPTAYDLQPVAELYLTARDGAVTVCIDRQGVVKASSYIMNDETQTNASRTTLHAE